MTTRRPQEGPQEAQEGVKTGNCTLADPYARTYQPSLATLTVCQGCGSLCHPWPNVDSGLCSWCWYVAHLKIATTVPVTG